MSTLTDSPQIYWKKRFDRPYHAKNMRHLKHASSQIFLRNSGYESILWSRTIIIWFASFVKGDSVTSAKKCKSIFWTYLDFFKKLKKKYAHVFFNFFEKIKSLWSPWSHHDFFGKSPKDFSFLDIFKMSKNKNPTSYSKYMKNEIWVLKASNTSSPYMVTCSITCWIFPYWLAQLIRNLLGTY